MNVNSSKLHVCFVKVLFNALQVNSRKNKKKNRHCVGMNNNAYKISIAF